MEICRAAGNGWPFTTPPAQATYAQVLLYSEALAQLKHGPKPGKPRRLKGKSKEAFYKAAEAKHGDY